VVDASLINLTSTIWSSNNNWYDGENEYETSSLR
jgi:hypothetical protein